MQIGFKRFDNDWILPVSGTQGNKSHNLFVHRDTAKAAGFKRPEAVVMPWEYLKAVPNPANFVLSVIGEWLPGGQRAYVRSDAPDEDKGQRIPGIYVTEIIRHEDRDNAGVLIERVINSYDTVQARRSRKMRGIPDTGMGLLLERSIGKKPADIAGAYTHCAGWAKILFVNPKYGHKAMISRPIEGCLVINGKLERPPVEYLEIVADEKAFGESPAALKLGIRLGNRFFTRDEFISRANALTEGRVALQLDYLVRQLPQQEGKGWEIEFLAWLSDSYVAQVTPIVDHPPVTVPNLESAFDVKEVVGTGDYTLDGILALPIGYADRVSGFDDTHRNYTVLTPFLSISGWDGRRARDVISLLNARAFLIINIKHSYQNTLSSHVEQFLRNTGVALTISFPDMKPPVFAAYSPTPHRIVADEASGKAVVLLKEPLKPFEPI